jgi:hypothetical protein
MTYNCLIMTELGYFNQRNKQITELYKNVRTFIVVDNRDNRSNITLRMIPGILAWLLFFIL